MGKAQLKWLLCACVLMGCTEKTTESVSPSNQGTSIVPVGNACGAANPCQNNEICTENGCMRKAEIGQSCNNQTACSQGVCDGGICKVTMMPGQACGNGRLCSESDCVDGVCLKKVLEGYDCRSSLTYCENGTCLNGICKANGSSGKTSYCTDTDGDTIGDEWDRCDIDTDEDTIPDCMDLDSDGDTIPDALERGGAKCDPPSDSDYNGIYDFMSRDSDGNSLDDNLEAPYLEDQYGRRYNVVIEDNVISIKNSSGQVVGNSVDPDSHMLLDAAGDSVDGVILNYPDTDKNGVPDFMDRDNDGDGVWDKPEILGVAHEKYQYLGEDAPRAADCDGDTLPDNPGSAAHPFDCDNDTIPDYLSMDSDGDGVSDVIEARYDTNKDGYLDRYSQDSDGDGVSDTVEFGPKDLGPIWSNGSLPDYVVADIDGDGLIDGLEVLCDPPSGTGCEDAAQSLCSGKCVDLQSDDANCGSCGAACEKGHHCEAGACVAACGELSLTECNSHCVNTNEDPVYCGDCNTPCDTNQQCISGVCTTVYFTCAREADTVCHGNCVDLQNDDKNCGSCDNQCAGGTVCKSGICEPDDTITVGKVDGRYVTDCDGDGFNDAVEYTAAIATGKDPAYFICDPTKGVKADPKNGITEGAFEFYFELPYQGNEKDDTLNFKPQVSMLDVVFNLDTTNSMGGEVANLKENIKNKIYPQIKAHVTDSAFGVSRFDDFPTRGTPGSEYDYLKGYGIKYGYGRASEADVPYQLLGRPETTEATVIDNVNKLGLHNGGDLPESGYESLWQLVMGDDKTKAQASWYAYGGDNTYPEFSSGSIAYYTPAEERWGGAGFRKSTLPVVIHITDTISHDESDSPYDPAYVENAHYSTAVHQAYVQKGARIISIFRKDKEHASELDAKVTGRRLNQLMQASEATNAVVPVCAFRTSETEWLCDANKCCTEMDQNNQRVGVDPTAGGQCVLSFGIDESGALSDSLVAGVDALVKYATSQVAAVVRGEPIDGSEVDTSCFIKRVEAFETYTNSDGELQHGYVAPPQQPETDCNPVATPASFGEATYNNGYSNFATGTSSKDRPGAELNFKVIAQNDVCVPPKEQAQVFTAHIDIIDPVTGVNYGSRDVSIIVPGEKTGGVN